MRILYSAGPGDIVQTFRFWQKGEDDPNQIAVTYSRQFYDFCKEQGFEGVALSSHPKRDEIRTDQFVVLDRPRSNLFSKGLLYHIGQLVAGARLAVTAKKYNCQVAVVSNFDDWFCLTLLRLVGVKVVPTLHCSFWSIDNRPTGAKAKVQQKLNTWFWRRCVTATICISPECEQQVRTLVPDLRSPIIQARATYRKAFFEQIPKPQYSRDQFFVFFAGRIEKEKGVLDIFEAAKILEGEHPGIFKWSICGKGSFLNGLKDLVARENAGDYFLVNGHLQRDRMLQEISKSNVFVVPTKPEFSEGLNKVAVEGVLAGRPVVASRYINGAGVLDGAVVNLDEVDSKLFAEAIANLYLNPEVYLEKSACTDKITEQFYSPDTGWKAALEQACAYCKK